MKLPRDAACADCKMRYPKRDMYRIRPPEPEKIFWLCQPCWDGIIDSAMFDRARSL